MEEHAFIMGLATTILLSLIGVIWVQLNNRIKKVEDWKVDKGHCKMKAQLAQEKFDGIGRRFDDIMAANSLDHSELKMGMSDMRDEQRKTVSELGDISKCLALLSEHIPCSTDHN